MNMLATLISAGGAVPKLYVDDVFSAYTYTGNGATQTINNGIDLAGEGGLVWIKTRTPAYDHALFNTIRGSSKELSSNSTVAEKNSLTDFTSFNANGFTLGTPAYDSNLNATGNTYASWTFRKAPKFFLNTTVTKSAGSNATIDLSSLGTVGMVMVKRTDAAGSWYVFHRSATAGKLLYLEQTSAEATLGHITVSGTTLTLVNGVIADGSYVVYAWAHDSSADGIIKCGSFTTDASGKATVNLGWEPQYLMVKASSVTGQWYLLDTSRAFSETSIAELDANSSMAEAPTSGYMVPTATGFKVTVNVFGLSTNVIYVAIRRSNKPPTTGTQVYNAIARTGTGAAATVTGVGFAPDLALISGRSFTNDHSWYDRLRGSTRFLASNTTNQDFATTSDVLSSFDMNGVTLGTNATVNGAGGTLINHFFKRAPGVFDEICFSGTGANKTEAHGLTVAPELWLVKGRSGATQWIWGSSLLANTEKIVMPTPAGKVTDATAWNSTYPTASVLSLGSLTTVNTSAATYVAYLWATKLGISKVFSYVGNGTTQNIDCGFTTGARFILIVRTSAAGSVYIWDTVRGVVAGNDPYLALDTTAAEVTTDDSVDPLTSGFTVNQVAASNINVTSATYIGLAFS